MKLLPRAFKTAAEDERHGGEHAEKQSQGGQSTAVDGGDGGGSKPSRLIPKEFAGIMSKQALMVLMAATRDTIRMTCLPRPPKIAMAASAAGICIGAEPVHGQDVKQAAFIRR